MSVRSAAAGIGLGCVGVLMLGLQPLLLGALLDEHRISVAQLTQAATLEQLMIGVVSGALGGLAPRRRLRLIAAIACLVLAGANAACLPARGTDVVLLRAICGVGGGALLWIAGAIVAFSQAPARLAGLFVGSQSISQFGLAALLPITLMPLFGSNGGFLAIAALAFACLALCPFVPSSIRGIVRETATLGRVNVAAVAGLAASFLFMAAIVGFFVFLEPLAAVNRVPTSLAPYAVAENLGAQILGAGLCVLFAARLAAAAARVLSLSAALFVLAMAVMWMQSGTGPFLLAVFIDGFVWTVGLTLFTPLLIQVDPTRRGAMLLAGTSWSENGRARGATTTERPEQARDLGAMPAPLTGGPEDGRSRAALAQGGKTRPLPWWVRRIAHGRLRRDERRAARRFRNGALPEEVKGY